MKKSKKIACLGTSANPPHIMHLLIANQILEFTDTDEVWLIVCGKHSFGKKLWPAKHRWKIAKLMERPGIKASDIEIKRGGVSYTLDTVLELKNKYPDFEFSWIVGSDLIYTGEYKKWGWWKKLSKMIKFWVIQRPGYPVHPVRDYQNRKLAQKEQISNGVNKKKLPKCFKIVSSKFLVISNISSTIIKGRLKKGLSIEGLVIPEVEKYIRKHIKK